MVVALHLAVQILNQRTGHRGLARDHVQSGMETVPVRDHLSIIDGGDVADLHQFADASAPFRVGLYDADRTCAKIVVRLPAAIEMLA